MKFIPLVVSQKKSFGKTVKHKHNTFTNKANEMVLKIFFMGLLCTQTENRREEKMKKWTKNIQINGHARGTPP